MDRRCRRGPALLLGLLLGAALAACSPAPARQPLTIGLNNWPGYGLLYVAEAKGFFRQEGLDVRLIDYPSLTDSRRAFERGQLDGFASTLVEVLQVRQNVDREPVLVLATDYSKGSDVLIARRGLDGVRALRGRRIGVEVETVGVLLLARALQSAGLTLADVEVVPTSQDRMIERFARNEVDAVVSYPPFSYGFAQHDDATVVFSSRQMPGELLDVLSFERSVTNARAAEIAALQRAWHRAADYFRAQPLEVARILAARDHAPVEAVQQALAGMVVLDARNQRSIVGDSQEKGTAAALLVWSEQVLADAGVLRERGRAVCCALASSGKAPPIETRRHGRSAIATGDRSPPLLPPSLVGGDVTSQRERGPP